jgi:phospholipase C
MSYHRALAPAGSLAVIAAVAAIMSVPARHALPAVSVRGADLGIHKFRHVIVIMQENRSFDSYFGSCPGATTGQRRPGHPHRGSDCRTAQTPRRRRGLQRSGLMSVLVIRE